MKKQFRRAGALMLALLMLMTAAPALAEDAPSAADGTQIEEIIGEEPAVTEAPTAIPTEIPTEAPTNTPNPTGIPTETPTETPILTEIPTEEPTNTEIPTENPTEAPTETPIPTDAPTEAPTATPDEEVFVPGLATLRSGAKLYANQQLTGDADVTEVSGTVYAEARTDSKRAVRIAFYDGVIVRTAWVKTSSTEMLTDEQTAAYDAIPRKPEDDLMAAHGHLLAPIPVHPEQKETPAPTEQPTEEPTATPEVTNPPEVTDAPTDVPTEAPTDVPEVTDAPTNPPEVTDAPTEVPEITEQPTAAPEVTNPPEITENPTEAPTDVATEAPTATPVPSAVETALRDFLNANGCAIAADEAIPADALARIGGVRLLEGNIDFTFLTDEGELEYRDSFYMNPWRRDDPQTPDVRGEALTTEINLSDFACFPNLQYLGVWDKRVTNLDALSKLPRLTTLVLDHCGLTESDLLTIAQHAPLLTTLNISNSSITSVAALASLTKLERLMISNTGVTTLTPLANLTIRQLMTENTAIVSINELRGTRLAKCIRQWNCPIVTDGYDLLGEMPQLEEVAINGDESTDKSLVLDLSPLANAQNLVWLDVGYVGVQDIHFVSRLPNLRYLLIATSNLTSMMIGEATLPETLAYIDFGGNRITSLEELHLERLQKLEYISLHANFITDFSQMEQCTATETWITDQHSPDMLMGWLGTSLREALNLPPKAFITQKMLDNVIGVTVRDGEIEWVFYEEQKNHDAWQRREREVNNWGKYVDKYSDNWGDPLFLTPNPTDADLPTMNPDSFDLSELQYFRHLHYFQLRNQQAEGTWVLPKLPIHWLILSNCGLTDADMPYITAINVDDGDRYNELYSLNLGNNAITSLSGMERLATLNVLLVQRNAIRDLSPLSDLTRIHLLNISWNPAITSIEPLAQGMRETLVNLDMAGLAVDLTPVGGMENLDHLRIGDDWNSHRIALDLAPLSGLTHLKYLHIFGAKVDNVEAISSMSGLLCINLQNCGLTSAKLTALNGHPLTTEINLERNFLRTLDELDLSTLPQLKEIALDGNAISDFSMFDGTAITVYGRDWQNTAY